MKKGKMLLLAGAACLACGGCGKDSAVQIVAPRETEQVDVITVENAAENSVREQVSAPEHVENEQVGAGVTLNADVEVPEVSGIQMKKVQWRDITNEDLELYQEVLFEGEPLCVSTDLYSMGLLTKEDIAQQIEELWKKYEGSLDEDEILQEIQDLDALYETAPDTLETEEVLLEIGPWQDEFWEDDGVEKTQAEVAVEQQNSYVGGYVKTARRTYYFNAANGSDFASVYLTDPTAQYWSEEWMRAQYGEGFEDEIVSGDGSLEQAKAQADALLSKLGLGDFAFFSESFEHFSNVSEGDTEMPYTRCYGMNYTRMVDGVPVSYAGDSVITSVGDSRQNETLRVVYDEKGLGYFAMDALWTVSDYSADAVFLLPFSEILSIFQSTIESRFWEMTSALGMEDVELSIDRITLGYTCIADPVEEGDGILIPVWDFFGTMQGADEEYLADSYYENLMRENSWLTINAMDGTIVDREYA